MSVLSAKQFHNEKAAFAFVEARVWPKGPVCPRCGEMERVGKLHGESTRIGVHKCYACRKPFTVRIGTIFESSHIDLRIWLQAMYLLASSKKGISSNQLARILGITLKSAWFLSHRIREAMRSGDTSKFGSGGGGVEVDETFIGREPGTVVKKGGIGHKMKVLSLVDRDTGAARSIVIDDMRVSTIAAVVVENVAKEARLLTDEAYHYGYIGPRFADHGTVKHKQDEYVSFADPFVHTQRVEGFFSVFKRGMKGVYQHCGKSHLHRYTAEFDFRYSNRIALGVDDQARFGLLVDGVKGKRLTYRTVGGEGPSV